MLNTGASASSSLAAAKPKPKRKAKGTVVVTIKRVGGIDSGSVETLAAKCPSGYSVFGGSALAHVTAAGIFSKQNAYTAVAVNPSASPNAAIPKSTAELLVGALCAKRGTPVVIDVPFPRG